MSWVRVLPEAALLFLLRKRELSSGVVALLCLVSMTDRSCGYTCKYMYVHHSIYMYSICTCMCGSPYLCIVVCSFTVNFLKLGNKIHHTQMLVCTTLVPGARALHLASFPGLSHFYMRLVHVKHKREFFLTLVFRV